MSGQDVQKALELLQEAVNLEPSNLEARANLAMVSVLIARHDIVSEELRAMDEIRIAAERRGEPVPFVQQVKRIADAYLGISDKVNAKIIYKELLKVAPDNEQIKDTLRGL